MAVTEGPRTFSYRAPWQGSRRFYVDGVSDPLSLVGAQLPTAGDAWPGVPSVKCLGCQVDVAKPGNWFEVRADYSFVPDGIVDSSGNPLDWASRVSMQTVEVMVARDVDLDGRPYVNLAGDPIEPGLTRVTYKRIQLRRYEPFYDTTKSDVFENAQNTLSVVIGAWTIKPYHMRLNSYNLLNDSAINALYIQAGYEFDIFLTDALGARPFDHPYLNQGQNAFYNDGTNTQLGRICTATSDNTFRDPVGLPIRLDLSGKPLSTVPAYAGLRAAESVFSNSTRTWPIIANPHPPTPLLTESITSSGSVVGYRIWYRGTKEADLNLLGL